MNKPPPQKLRALLSGFYWKFLEEEKKVEMLKRKRYCHLVSNVASLA
jgi:hypothetical protein